MKGYIIMSQEKVDKKKKYKANRKAILKKEKRKKILGRIISWLIVIAFVGGICAAVGTSVYSKYKAKLAALPDYKSTDFMLSDMAGILSTDTDTAIQDTAATDAAGQTAAVTVESTAAVTDTTGQTAAATVQDTTTAVVQTTAAIASQETAAAVATTVAQ